MFPEAIGAAALHVHEPLRRLPDGDLALPAQGDAPQPQPVFDDGAAAHLRRPLGENAKVEPGRGDGLQVPGLGEKGEDVPGR